MLNIRPLVIDGGGFVLGGNMRLKAIKELGIEEVSVILADELTEEQKREFVIKDNISYGEWDWEELSLGDWNYELMEEWGLDTPVDEKIDKLEEGEVLDIPKSLQVIPKKEYILIMADEDSEEWEELKQIFSCGLVRQGGCKIGSSSDKVGTGLERVFDLKTFKKRVINGFRDSNTK